MFLPWAVGAFIADVWLWQRCYGQPLQSEWPEPPSLPPEQSLCAGIPRYSCPCQAVHAEKKKKKGTVGSCLKALQPAASGRYDMPKTVGLSGVHEGSLSYLGCSGLLLVLGSVPRVSGDLASSLVSNSDPA